MPESKESMKRCVQVVSSEAIDILMDAPVGIFTSTPDGRYISANHALAKMYGYDSAEELIESIADIAAQIYADKADREKLIQILMTSGIVINHECKYIRRDGTTFWVSRNIKALKGDDGKIVAIQGFTTDITERKRMETALQESEANFRNFFESTTDILWVCALDGRIILTNQAANTILGYSPEELTSMSVLDVHPKDSWQEANKIFTEMLNGQRSLCPLPLERKDGTLVSVETRIWFGRWHGADCIFGISKNLSSEQEERQRFERLFHSNPTPMALSSLPERRFLEVNDAFLATTGYSRQEIVDKTSMELHLFPDKHRKEETVKILLEKGRITDQELSVRCKDGSLRQGIFFGEVIVNHGKRYLLTVMIDITESKRAETSLRKSEERYRDLSRMLRLMCDNVPDMIWAKDLDKRYLFANKAVCRDLLLAENTTEPLNRSDLFFAQRERDRHPGDPAWHTFGELCQDSDQVTLDAGVPMCFEEFGNIQGRYLCLEVHKAPFVDNEGNVIGVVGSARDVTEQRKIAINMAESEAKYRAIYDMASVGILLYDQSGTVQANNVMLTKILGVKAPEASVGTHLLTVLPDGPIKKAQMLALSRGTASYEGWYTTAKGKRVAYLRIQHRRMSKNLYMALYEDFTDLVRSNEELAKAKELAQAANRAKDEFLTNMSHELRTPLNGVLGMLQLLQDSHLDQEQKVLVVTAQDSGRSLLAIINDILDFAQIEAGKITLQAEPVDMRALLEFIGQAFRFEAQSRGLVLRVEVDSSVPEKIDIDPGRLRQVLFNLVGNSLKFTERGEVHVNVSTLPASPNQDRRILLFSVSDTGIGIPDDKIETIFQPFSQLNLSLNRKAKGTGIGLGIVRALINHMGGEVTVESKVGLGTTMYFTVYYCVSDMSKEQVETFDEIQLENFSGLRVLLAEDDLVNRFATTRFLERLGCKVISAINGQEALHLLAQDDFDAMVMDIQMPILDGIAATKIIRTSSEFEVKSKIIILAMTAHALPGDREKFLAAGVDGYIAKPVDADELARVLAKLVKLHRR